MKNSILLLGIFCVALMGCSGDTSVTAPDKFEERPSGTDEVTIDPNSPGGGAPPPPPPPPPL